MRAGELRQRIVLHASEPERWQQFGETTVVGGWSIETVWAAAGDVRYDRSFGDTVRDDETTATFLIRYRKDHARVSHVVWGSRIFQVRAVLDPDGHRRELRLECLEIAP